MPVTHPPVKPNVKLATAISLYLNGKTPERARAVIAAFDRSYSAEAIRSIVDHYQIAEVQEVAHANYRA